MSEPRISVVVPTYQRVDRIVALVPRLLSLEEPEDYEVIVVDDGSTDGTAERLRRLVADDRTGRLRVERVEGNHGPARARNRGWQVAAAPFVAFTDDDCVPRSGWLAGLLGSLEDGNDVVQGRTVPDPTRWGNHGAFFHTIEIQAPTLRFETCNIAYRRELLERLGGFDEGFSGESLGEDMDLGLRAREAGATLAFAPDAIVEHEVTPSDLRRWWRGRRRRAGLVRLVEKHPELRDALPLGMVTAPEHPRALGGTIGAGLALLPGSGIAPRLLGIGLVAQYVHFRVREERIHGKRRHWPWAIPVMMVGEAYESLTVAATSLRRGFLLL